MTSDDLQSMTEEEFASWLLALTAPGWKRDDADGSMPSEKLAKIDAHQRLHGAQLGLFRTA